MWGLLAERGVPVVVHASSIPLPGRCTGPAPIGGLLEYHPTLPLVVAHLGMPEYDEFFELAETFPNVRLDTTMTFTDFAERGMPFPARLRPRLRDLGLAGKVLLGSDFPNIPPLRPPASRAGQARPGRRLAPRGLLGQRGQSF
ncbi:amidohydrolase family protein [Streptosporangium sp. NBC_01755]|uniref:amidohydrolase family protein n=1 Tax=Streptosporangium sp. NBC_01755 TaxID=2975949 RepID=UPI002DDAFF91|nr:amidohydrolase family protein [Streptosporangium sp. NBC_01755]